MEKKRQYITTAIDYPNAAPHMGHVLEKVLADVMARWFRLKGETVRFQIGTDEHGVKIQRAAQKAGMEPQAFVDGNVAKFVELYEMLAISSDAFLRTTDRARHWPTVQALWKKLQQAGALEKRSYTGLYCPGCEKFLTKKDLLEGKCPDHLCEPEEVTEENWFFLLARETAWLKDLLTRPDGYRIVPPTRAQETLALLERGLEDVSFSRPKSSLAWGIPVPGDEEQTMYVWCDALTNYISGLGFFTEHEDGEWWNDATVTHVIGKDIARFHALIWPAMLKNAGVRTPDRLLIHGFVTNEGQKMSKSIGNVVDPVDVLAKFGGNPDPLRFFLCSEIPVGNDGDFSWKRLEEMYDAKLRNQLGNLLNRVLVLLKKEGGILGEMKANISKLQDMATEGFSWEDYAKAMGDFDLSFAINEGVMGILVNGSNSTMHFMEPWKKTGEEKLNILSEFAELLRHVSLLLLPFLPDTAYRISKQLNVPYAEEMLERDFVITPQLKEWGGAKGWTRVGEPEILFKPLE